MKNYRKLFTDYILRQEFRPSLSGIFFNPYYIIRNGLKNEIKNNSYHINGKVLDFGCGSKPYKSFFNSTEYIGIDIDIPQNKENENIDFIYDGISIPFPDEYFDSIFSSEVFEHIFDLDVIMKELNRVLKKTGKILVTVPFIWDEHAYPSDFGRYTSYGIKHVFEKSGFSVIKISKTTNYIETLFQMWNNYLFKAIHSKNHILNHIICVFIISPFTISGIILGKILPKNYDYYNNNVIIAQKI